VGRFLSNAFHLRLNLDLGESLEAAAPGFPRLRQGLTGLADYIGQAAETAAPREQTPRTPEHWLGLPGWTWVTEMMEALMSRLTTSPT
jgi:hypothetical protein